MKTTPARIDGFRLAGFNHDLTIVTNVEDGMRLWRDASGHFDLILLDHDLGGEQMTPSDANSGYGFSLFIQNDLTPQDIVVVHSYNPEGAARMMQALKLCGPTIIRQPFGLDLLKWLQLEGWKA